MNFRNTLLFGALCLIGGASLAVEKTGIEAVATSSASAGTTVSTAQAEQRVLNKADVDAWLDGYMPYALHTGDIPGAVVVVVKDGQILTERGFGYADVEKRTPVDPERTLFRPGSVSKLITWTAVMQLVEQNKLDLDRDVNTYLDFKIPAHDGQPITLRQIMTHTAGFNEVAKNIIFFDPAHKRSLGDYVKAAVPLRIFDAGTTPAYSNYATALAGYIVERASGEQFDDYTENHIFRPLGMHSASFRQPLPANLASEMAQGYPKAGQPAAGFEIVGPGPAGGLSASGDDMARFMLANLQQGELDGHRLMTADTLSTMHNSPLANVNPYSLVPPLNRMELGFFETNTNGREVIGHLGDTEAFHTSLHLFLKEGVGFYVSFNSPGKEGAVGTLRTAMFHDFADRYFPDISPADGGVDLQLAAEHARAMAGIWQNSRRAESNFFAVIGLISQTKVEVNAKGELEVPSLLGANGRPREWVEIAPYVWRDKNGHDRLAAKLVDGKPVRWSMDFMSPFMVFDRVPAGLSSAWIMPILYAAIAVLLLTFLAWPIGWIGRRYYKVPLSLTGSALRAARATQIASGLSLAVLAGWTAAFAAMFTSLKNTTDAFDTWLWLLQASGAVVFVATVLISAWNVQQTWTDGRGSARKIWSALIALAALHMLYVAFRFDLISFTVNY